MQRLYGNGHDNETKNKFMSKISPKSGSVSTIIRSFKSICTREINKMQEDALFQWQPRFHDSIIRNVRELKRVHKYIKDNPKTHLH